MKKFSNRYRILASVFVVVLVTPTILFPILRGVLSTEKGELNENRNLAEFQFDFNNFGANFEKYYNDHIPFRKSFIKLYNKLQGQVNENLVADDFIRIENGAVFGENDWLFLGFDNEIDDYLGNNILTEQQMTEYMAIAVQADNYFHSKGKRLVFQICPNKSQVYSEYMPSGYKVQTDYKRINRLFNYMIEHSAVKITYPLKQMFSSKALGYEPYYKFDTHHNSMGAFVAYSELQKLMNIPTTDIRDLTINERTITGGDLANFILQPGLFGAKEYDITYNPIQQNQNIAFFGDSFRSNQVQYLTKDFTTVNHFHRSEIADTDPIKNAINSADIIVVSSVERDSLGIFGAVIKLMEICTKI